MNSNELKDFYSIAIDGPAGAGKSTIAKKVAEILNIEYIDTGAMYRALTLKVINVGIDIEDKSSIIELLKETEIDFNNKNIYLDGNIVNEEIRDNIISKNVSYIAVIPEVRKQMLAIQQNMALSKDVIMDGRDICSVVLPNSKYKFFITASSLERGKRRYKELIEKGIKNVTLEEIIKEINERDYIDSNRDISPLIKKDDTYLIDNTNKTIDQSVNEIISIVREEQK